MPSQKGDLDFTGRVAIVTGAGGGTMCALRSCYLCRTGVVVNDLGGSREGSGQSKKAADLVVDEIVAKGGKAVANYDSVTDGDRIVKTAIDSFGRVDILINNAGILRDKSLVKMTSEDWKLVQDVHLHGAYMVTKAAWPHMVGQKYGKIIMTTSAAGLYGNYGQTNYSSAKLGLYGLGRCLALEGAKYGICCNVIAPMAGSRITETVLPPEVLDLLKPDYVTYPVAFLCHQSCAENGAVFEVGGGYIARVIPQRSEGFSIPINIGKAFKCPIGLIDRMDSQKHFKKPMYPKSIQEVNWIELAEKNQNVAEKLPGPGISLKDCVAIITGAGNGLGRAYAFLLAAHGAKVVINDCGKDRNGRWSADIVVEQIKSAGGDALANYDSVLNGDSIVKACVDKYGRIDILINNAGILRDKSFTKMTKQDWDQVIDVHLNGTFKMTKAAIPVMLKQKFGRIVNTASAVGLYGNFGQANYSAAKAAILSFSKSLAKEVAKANILVNSIAPNAGTSMTATVLPENVVKILSPDYVAPFVLALIAPENKSISGRVFEIGSGWAAEVRWQRSKWVRIDSQLLPSIVSAVDMTKNSENAKYPQDAQESFIEVQEIAKSKKNDKNTGGKLKLSIKDIITYNLGIGFGEADLEYVYEGSSKFKAFPTIAVIPGFESMLSVNMNDILSEYNPVMLLHGEHYIETLDPIKNGDELISTPEVVKVEEKGKGTVVTVRVTTRDQTGNIKCINEGTTFNRGAYPRHNIASKKDLKAFEFNSEWMASAPNYIVKDTVPLTQAAIYRLSGDQNPLHIDPTVASMAGFKKPILHGLCTFGFAARHVVKAALDNIPEKLLSIQGRFAKHVYPGETLQTEIWKVSDDVLAFAVKVIERNDIVLTNGVCRTKKEVARNEKLPSMSDDYKFVEIKKIFGKLPDNVRSDLVKKISANFGFIIKSPNGSLEFSINMKSGSGSVSIGSNSPDVIIETDQSTFEQLFGGKIKGQTAFMKGLLKIKGNMMLATKLDPLLSALRGKLN